jgi:tetratricopeptide (TPR) repeat protein
MKFLLPAFLVLLLSATGLRAQHLTVAEADSLKLVLGKAKADTSRVRILLSLSNYYGRKTWKAQQNRDTALTLAQQAKALSDQLSYDNGRTEAVFMEGRIFVKGEMVEQVKEMLPGVSGLNRARLLLELGKQYLLETNIRASNRDLSLSYFEMSEALSVKMGNNRLREESQQLLGYTYLLQEDTVRAQRYFENVISARRKAGDKAGELMAILRIYNFELVTRLECGDCKRGIGTLMRALDLARQLGDGGSEVMTINLLAFHYMITGNLREARRLAEEGLALQKQVGYRVLNRAWHALIDEAVYGPQYSLADISNAHLVLATLAEWASRYDQALDHYMQLIKGLEDAGLHEELAYPYFWIGMNYFELNEVDKSVEYFRQSLAISHRKGEAAVVYLIFRLFAEALVKQGNPEQALRFIQTVHEQNLPMPLHDKIYVLLTLGHCHSALKQYPRAEPFYREAVNRSERVR